MQTLTLWDHLLALTVFVAYPLLAKRNFPALVRRVREHGEAARVAAYRQTIMTTLSFAVLLLAMWLTLDRDWALLGIRGFSTAQFAWGLLLAVAVLLLTIWQFRTMLLGSDDKVVGSFGDLEALMPRTSREQFWFRLVSGNAGVSEELLYRGYVIWYLTQFVNLAWAAVIAVLLFTFAHSYQGLKQVPGLMFISTVLVALYLISGSLLLPILFHAVFDMVQGHYIQRVLRQFEMEALEA